MLKQSTVWEANPLLKKLLIVLMFASIFSGIALVLFGQMQIYYRNKLYIETQNSLPIQIHKIKPLTK